MSPLLCGAFRHEGRRFLPVCRSLRRTISTPPAISSCQNVTLPVIPELFEPDFLNILIPLVTSSPAAPHQQHGGNLMMDALRATGLTENLANTYTSTLSPTLDAFQVLRPRTRTSELWNALDEAWEEDPALTLRLIWNSRSIIDGKGSVDVFYRYAPFFTPSL